MLATLKSLVGNSLTPSTIALTTLGTSSRNVAIKAFITLGIALSNSTRILNIAVVNALKKRIEASSNTGIVSIKKLTKESMIVGNASTSASMIVGKASTNAINSVIDASISCGNALIKNFVIVLMILGNAFTSSVIIVGKASIIAINSCIAPSSITGIDSNRKFKTPSIKVGKASIIVGEASIKAVTRLLSKSISALSINGALSINDCAISTITSISKGTNVGNILDTSDIKVDISNKNPSIICGKF